MAELITELLRGGDDQVVELLQRGGARFQCAGSCDVQLTDRLDDPARLLGHGGRSAAEGGAGGEFGVDRVALAEALPGVRMRLIDLDHGDPFAEQRTGETGSVGASRFDPDPDDLALGA